jgi:multidrug resistance protein, MATE family
MQTTSSALRRLAGFALPICASFLINMIANFVAMMMVGKLGHLQLAAGALAVSTYITILTIGTSLFYAIGILISHARGQEKNPEEIGQIVKNGLWLTVMLGLPGGILLWNVNHVLIFFKQDPRLVAIAQHYFHHAAFAMFTTLVLTLLNQFYMGVNRPKLSMFTALISLPLNILLAYGLVLGHFGLPQLGLGGITFSTSIVQALVCAIALISIHYSSAFNKYRIFSGGLWPNKQLCKNILQLGLPIGAQSGIELAAMAGSTYLMGFFGVFALAASQIVSQYVMLVIMVILGMSQALAVLVSEAYGRHDINLVRLNIRAAFILLVSLFSVILTLFFFYAPALINFYIDSRHPVNQHLVHLASKLFVVAGVLLFCDGARNLLAGALRGLHDPKTPMRVGIICLWFVSLPLSYLVGFGLKAGPVGLRAGFVTGFFLAAIFLWKRLRSKIMLWRSQGCFLA